MKDWLKKEAKRSTKITGVEVIKQGKDFALRLRIGSGRMETIGLGNHAKFMDDVPKDVLEKIAEIFGISRYQLENENK